MALNFGAGGSGITVPATANNRLLPGPVTIAAWVRASSIVNGMTVYGSPDDGAHGAAFQLRVDSTGHWTLRIGTNTGGTAAQYITTAACPVGSWVFVVATYNFALGTNQGAIYLGDLTTPPALAALSTSTDAASSANFVPETGTGALWANRPGSAFGWRGDLALAQLYNRVPSLAEIMQIWARGAAVAGCVQRYECGFTGTATQVDWSGLKQGGTISGGTVVAHVPRPVAFGGDEYEPWGPLTTTVTGSGSAGEGEGASGTGSGATIAGSGAAGEGEGASGTGSVSGAVAGTGSAGEGEGAIGTGVVLNAWQGVMTYTDSSQGVALPFAYQVFLPKNWSAIGAKWPVVTYLHGSVERGADGVAQLAAFNPASGGVDLTTFTNFPAIVIAPQLPSAYPLGTSAQYRAAWIHLIAAGLPQQIAAQYNGDTSRLALTGLSLGGENAYTTIYEYPGVFAAFAPLSATLVVYSDFAGAATFTDALTAYVASPGSIVPTRIYQGGSDSTVPASPNGADQISAALIAAGRPTTYIKNPSGDHSLTYWDTIYSDITFWNWITGQQGLTATGSAGEGEGASGTGTVSGGGTVSGTGSAGEGEGIVGTAAGATITGTGAAGEGEGAIGTAGGAADSGSGSGGEGGGASGTGGVAIGGTGSAGEGEGASGTSGGAAVSGSGSGAEGEGATGSGSITESGAGSASSGAGASGAGGVTNAASGGAGAGERATGIGIVIDPASAHAVLCTRVSLGPRVRVRRVRVVPTSSVS